MNFILWSKAFEKKCIPEIKEEPILGTYDETEEEKIIAQDEVVVAFETEYQTIIDDFNSDEIKHDDATKAWSEEELELAI